MFHHRVKASTVQDNDLVNVHVFPVDLVTLRGKDEDGRFHKLYSGETYERYYDRLVEDKIWFN